MYKSHLTTLIQTISKNKFITSDDFSLCRRHIPLPDSVTVHCKKKKKKTGIFYSYHQPRRFFCSFTFLLDGKSTMHSFNTREHFSLKSAHQTNRGYRANEREEITEYKMWFIAEFETPPKKEEFNVQANKTLCWTFATCIHTYIHTFIYYLHVFTRTV